MMNHQSFCSAFIALLKQHGRTVSAADVLYDMEADYLFLHRNGRYIAGRDFITPSWLHMYLQPCGLKLTQHVLPRKDLSALMADHMPLLLQTQEDQYLLPIACRDQRVCLAQPSAAEVPEQWLTLATLRKHLPDPVTAYTLDACPPAPVDFKPLLVESVHTYAAYEQEVLPMLQRTVTREDMRQLHVPYFRAIMVELSLLAFRFDAETSSALRLLNHVYRHLFAEDDVAIRLGARIPKRYFRSFLNWMQENIIDRLYELGASDELLEECYSHDPKV